MVGRCDLLRSVSERVSVERCKQIWCFCRLSGLSPFMGATDIETMANVTIAKYDFEDEAFQEISDNAKDFIKNLLLKDIRWGFYLISA